MPSKVGKVGNVRKVGNNVRNDRKVEKVGKKIRVENSSGKEDVLRQVNDAMTSTKEGQTPSDRVYTPVLVLVYGSRCGHCVAFEDDWQALSASLAKQSSMNSLAVEADVLSHFPRVHAPGETSKPVRLMTHLSEHVQSVPYIAVWAPDGSTTKFENERTPENVISFVEGTLHEKTLHEKTLHDKVGK